MEDLERLDGPDLAARLTDLARTVADDARDAGPGNPITAVVAAHALQRLSQAALRAAIERARARDHTWQEIGDVLGTTRQAAFQRFGRPTDPRTGAPMHRNVLPDAAQRAAGLLADLADHRWAAVCRDFTPTMAAHLDADGVAAAWAQVAGTVGRYEAMGEPAVRQLGDLTVVDVPLAFEAGELTARVSYDRDARVAGLYLLHPTAATG